MEEMLQVATVMLGVAMFISAMGLVVNGFQCMLAGGNVRIAVEAKTQMMGDGIALVFGSFALLILELMKVSEGLKTTTEVYEVMTFVAQFVLGMFVIVSVLGGVCILVSKLWKKSKKAFVRQNVHETPVVAVEESMQNNNEIKPQEQAVVEMEKVLRIIQTRY